MRVKRWSVSEADDIAGYLSSVAERDAFGFVLRVSDRATALEVEEALAIAVTALRGVVDANRNGSQVAIDRAFEDWIGEHMADGGREKLIAALRKRRQRSDSPDPKPEPAKPNARLVPVMKEIDALSPAELLTFREYLDRRLQPNLIER